MTILRDFLYHQGFIVANTGSTDLQLIDAMESQAVSKSSPELAMVLGEIWGEGIAVPVDEKSSMGWYLFAADLGDRDAQVNCGFSYREGRGVERNLVKAAKWFTKAAKAGDPEAQCELAKFAMSSGHDWQLEEEDDADVERAFALHWTRDEHYGFIAMLRQSAEQGFAEAQACLGWNYEKGFFEEKNIEQALHWYEMAARQGDLNARSALQRLRNDTSTYPFHPLVQAEVFRVVESLKTRGFSDFAHSNLFDRIQDSVHLEVKPFTRTGSETTQERQQALTSVAGIIARVGVSRQPLGLRLDLPTPMSASSLAHAMSLKASDVIKHLMKRGHMLTINTPLEHSLAMATVLEMGFKRSTDVSATKNGRAVSEEFLEIAKKACFIEARSPDFDVELVSPKFGGTRRAMHWFGILLDPSDLGMQEPDGGFVGKLATILNSQYLNFFLYSACPSITKGGFEEGWHFHVVFCRDNGLSDIDVGEKNEAFPWISKESSWPKTSRRSGGVRRGSIERSKVLRFNEGLG